MLSTHSVVQGRVVRGRRSMDSRLRWSRQTLVRTMRQSPRSMPCRAISSAASANGFAIAASYSRFGPICVPGVANIAALVTKQSAAWVSPSRAAMSSASSIARSSATIASVPAPRRSGCAPHHRFATLQRTRRMIRQLARVLQPARPHQAVDVEDTKAKPVNFVTEAQTLVNTRVDIPLGRGES